MIKFWKLKRNKNTAVILINDINIYTGKVKSEDINNFSRQIENNIIPENLFSIPFSYIKRIENQENKNKIAIYYGGDSEEELIIDDKIIKAEIFDYLKNNLSELNYSKVNPSIFNYAKPQVFAILFTLGLFLWSLYYAIQIENGVEYVLKGRAGIGSIMYSIGLLGIVKVCIIFSILIGISIYAFLKKIKSKSQIEQLIRL